MGVLTAASTVAFLIIGLPAGVWVDRIRRRYVMIAADLGRIVVLGSIPVSYALGVLGLLQLYLVALASGVFTVFFDVAYQSYLPSLVGREHLVEGNAKLTGSEQVSQVVGPSVAGGLVQAIGGPYAVALDVASFAVSATAVRAIRKPEAKPPTPAEGHPRLRQDIGQGLRFVFGHPLLRAITATTGTSNLFSGIQAAVEVIFLVTVVHAKPVVIGLVFAVGSIGGVLAAFVASPIARRIGGARATVLSSFAVAGGLLMPLATPGLGIVLFAAGFFLSSFAVVVYNINQVSFRQRLCPDKMLGRMNATIRFVVYGALPIGALAGGAIGAAIGLRTTLWIAIAGESLAGVWLLASPMRGIRDFPSQSP